MTDRDPVDLVLRVNSIEREVRWWRRLASVAVLCLVLAPLAGAADPADAPRELRAKAFVLVDDAGHRQAELGFFPAGDGSNMPRLVLWGKQGGVTAQIDGFPSINLLGTGESSRVTMSVRSDDEAMLEFIDGKGLKRVVLGRSELKIPETGQTKQLPVSSLVLRGEDDKVVWKSP